jgi:protein-disulfide isomerase
MNDETKENIFALIIVVILLVGVGWWIYHQMYAPQPPQEEVTAQIPIGASPVLGSENASMTVVVFSDFECPFCGQFARETFPQVKAKYVDTGKMRIVFKQFPLSIHEHAELAAQASLCAHDQEKFWEYHDLLYSHQQDLALEDLKAYAQDIGLNAERFNSCLDSGQYQTQVASEKVLGTQSSVTGTPTFFFNGKRVVGALSVAEFDTQFQ